MEIPIEVEWQYGKKPTPTDVGYLLIKAPTKHNGWSLGGLQYKNEEIRIPIKEYISEKEFPGMALYDIAVTTTFIKGGKFSVHYTPDPVIGENGAISGTLCMHVQEVAIEF